MLLVLELSIRYATLIDVGQHHSHAIIGPGLISRFASTSWTVCASDTMPVRRRFQAYRAPCGRAARCQKTSLEGMYMSIARGIEYHAGQQRRYVVVDFDNVWNEESLSMKLYGTGEYAC